MASTYIDPIAYLKQPTGLTLGAYVGNIGRISSCVAGATSLTVTSALTVGPLNQYNSLYVFDGPNSEQLQIGPAGAAVGSTTIPLQSATAYAHSAGVVYCTDGAAGSLGEQIFIASRYIEDDVCHQALWQTSYTGEILTMPTMRASIDNQANLHFRPRHFPITALFSVSVISNQQLSWSYDPTQAIIDSDQQTVDLPQVALLTSNGNPPNQTYTGNPWVTPGMLRSRNAWVTIAYTAGFAVGSLPPVVTRAATLLTSEMFSQVVNPVGADSINQGKRQVVFAIRGDTSGESLLVKQAKQLLSPYITQSF